MQHSHPARHLKPPRGTVCHVHNELSHVIEGMPERILISPGASCNLSLWIARSACTLRTPSHHLLQVDRANREQACCPRTPSPHGPSRRTDCAGETMPHEERLQGTAHRSRDRAIPCQEGSRVDKVLVQASRSGDSTPVTLLSLNTLRQAGLTFLFIAKDDTNIHQPN